MPRNPLNIAVGALLLLIFILLLFLFQVRRTEVAVVTTFGKPTRDVTEPGAYFKWPWPVQKVYRFDQRVQNFESKFEQVLTADGYNLLVMVYAGWRISDPKLFLTSFNGSVPRAGERLEGLVRNAYSGVVGRHPLAHFVSTDPAQIRFAEIEQEMLQRVQADARASHYGLDVDFLSVKKLGLPESVTKLVFERMQSEREVRVSEIKSEGERQASEIRSKADFESARLLTEADARALKLIGEGENEAARSFEVFKQEPDLAVFLLKLKSLEAFLKEKATLVLDESTSPLDILKDQQPVAPKK
jgi:membrane protease subunit HflC